MHRIGHSVYVLLFLILPVFSWSQTEEDIKEEAAKLFEKEAYVDATSLYLRLISLNPKDADYNFRYGTCLLFNSYKKQEAIRYLNFAVTDANIDPRAYYFHGRALHLNYEFDKAIQSYQKYLSKRGKRDTRYNVERQIQMCENGKRLLTTFTDIIVSDKKEIDKSKFFRLYNDANTIGGTILVSEEFQSKIDKKKGHIPIVHFPPNAQAIYYSSYGESEETGLDIYIRRRLPDGTWGDPQKLPGDVNTNEDEDFPYMHPSGEYLYFSSKGHNSMGGYDVFYSLYNPNTNSFGTPVNVDFAISSPDDDLFYVVDEGHKNAYFASARQSQNGKLHVYKVRVARVPIQEVIIMGDYLSEVNPDNKDMNVTVFAHSNGEEVGKIKTNAQGKYSFVFPKGGKYDYEVKVGESGDIYKFLVEVPFLDEFRPLKQKAIHTTEDGAEIVKIVNLFDEKVEGAEAIIAEVIRKRSELNVNLDQFDLEEIDAQEERDKVLAELGFQGMSMKEVSDQLEDLAITEKLNKEKANNIEANINNEIITKSNELASIDTRIEQQKNEANNTDSPTKKHELLLKVQSLETEKLLLATEVENLATVREKIIQSVGKNSDSGIGPMEMLENQYNALMSEGKEKEALDLLAKKKEQVNAAKENSPNGIVQEMIQESITLSNEIDALVTKEREMEQEQRRLQEEIKVLENRLPEAKKKEAEQIREELSDKGQELTLVKEYLEKTKQSIKDKKGEQSVLDSNIASLQKAMLEEPATNPDVADVNKSVEVATEAITEVNDSNIEEQITSLVETNPELNPDYEASTTVDTYESQYAIIESVNSEEIQSIEANASLSEEDKLEQYIALNEQTIEQVENRLAEIGQMPDNENVQQMEEEKQKLEEYRAQLQESNADYKEQLETVQGDVAVSVEEVISEVDPAYNSTYEAIEQSDLPEKEKLNELQQIDKALVNNLNEEIQNVDQQLEQDPENGDLIARKEVLEVIQSETQDKIANRETEIASLPEENVVLTKEEVLTDIDSQYSNQVNEIKRSENTEQEQLEALQQLDEQLLNTIDEQLSQVNKALGENPDDQTNQQRKELLTQLQQEKQSDVQERSERLETLASNENSSNVTNTEEIRAELENELYSAHKEKIEEINNSESPEDAKTASVYAENVEYLADLEKKKDEIDKTLERNPDDNTLTNQQQVIEQLITEQKEKVNETRAAAIEAISDAQVEEAVTQVDKNYSVDIGELEQSTSPTKYDDIANREDVLQEALQGEIDNVKKQLERKYSVTAELELAVYEKAKAQSEQREEIARNTEQIADVNTTVADQKKEFIDNLRQESLGDEQMLNAEYTSKEELTAQDAMLAEYEAQLDEEIENVSKKAENEQENQELNDQLSWLKEEKERVADKRRRISVTLGELETEIVETNTNDQEVVKSLNDQEQALRAELNDENTDNKRKKEIRKELNTITAERTEKENVIYENNLDQGEVTNKALTEDVAEYKGSDQNNGVVDKVLEINSHEQEAIENLRDEANKAKSEEEKNYLLKEANDRQEELNKTLAATAEDMKRSEIEENESVDLMTEEELEKRRRKFTVQIGELTTDIMHTDAEISSAKKKEIPALEAKRAELVDQRTLLELKLQEVEDRLLQKSPKNPVVEDAAMEESITFNEERKTAGTEEYESYYNLATEALEVETQIANLEDEIKEEQRKVNDELVKSPSERNNEQIDLSVARIKELQSEVDRLSVDLVQMKYDADRALPSDEVEAMRMKNLVVRGVRPIKATLVAATILQMPSNGFAIDPNGESVYSAENPIPVGVENPSGLVYRVQIGAFARPIPQDLFKEFNPVSGEKIGGTNVTRYMAGFFSSSETVTDAREKIRALGYNDAFVVAYCDGERIQLWDARKREREGTCVPKGTNELMVEIAAKTAEAMGLPTTNEVREVPEHSYNEAPGAADADPIEIKQGLFFTVQIGVFNRPVGPEFTHGMDELLTIRLPNGQIRYASGMFDSVEEALPRREKALANGVKGAFVTAYYKGERIPLWQAKQLLAENGKSILQSEIEKAEKEKEKVEPEIVVENNVPVNNVVRTDTVSTENVTPYYEEEAVERRIQIITKEKYDEFPRDILNRYNSEGNFYFDEKDSLVKSVVYKSEDDLPRLWNFRENIDTVYLSMDESGYDTLNILEVQLNDSLPLPGDFMDWLMRYNYRKEFHRLDSGMVVRIFGIEPNMVSEVQGIIRRFGLEATLLEETEYELEMTQKQ